MQDLPEKGYSLRILEQTRESTIDPLNYFKRIKDKEGVLRCESRIADLDNAIATLKGGAGPVAHPDDVAVDTFAAAMKAKMAKQRAKGYGGWDNPEDCTADFLRERLAHHVGKGDPVDIGNFAMMLWNRRESTAAQSAQENKP